MASTGFVSPYSPNTDRDRRAMLDAIGVDSVSDLFEDIPKEHRDPPLDLPPPLSEMELRREIDEMARENLVPGEYACFLGAGAYRHYIPAVVRQIAEQHDAQVQVSAGESGGARVRIHLPRLDSDNVARNGAVQ